MNESQAIQAAQHGNLNAFNHLVLTYQGLAYNVAYRILGDADAAADATQDSFIKAFRSVSSYRHGSFKGWLLRIVTNTCYDTLRWQKRHQTSTLDGGDGDEDEDSSYDTRLVDRSESPEEHALRGDLGRSIQSALTRLPAEQRTALVLCDVEGLDYQEAASTAGVPLGTLKSRLSRARLRLSELLAQQGIRPVHYVFAES